MPPTAKVSKYIFGLRKLRSKLSWPIRKLAKFTQFHTGLQPVIARFQRLRRQTWKKPSFQFRKLAKFTLWHTGLSAPPIFKLPRYQFRKRQVYKTASFWLRKIARFYPVARGRGWVVGGIPPTIQTGLVNFVKNFRSKVKRQAFQIRKAAHFTTWHTGVQPNPKIWFLQHRYDKLKHGAWQLRKLARFTLFNSGEEGDIGGGGPAPFGLRFFSGHVRSFVKRASFQLRKIAHFTQWHTGATPPVPAFFNGRDYLTRTRSFWKKTNFQFRKLARFTTFHTGIQQTTFVVFFRHHKRPVWKKKARFAFFFGMPNGHTGLTPPPPVFTQLPWVSAGVLRASRGGGNA